MLVTGEKPAGMYEPGELRPDLVTAIRDAGCVVIGIPCHDRGLRTNPDQLALSVGEAGNVISSYYIGRDLPALKRLLHAFMHGDAKAVALGYPQAEVEDHIRRRHTDTDGA